MTYKPTTDDLIDTYVIWHLQRHRNSPVDVSQQAERDLRAEAEQTLTAHDAEVRAQALREAADELDLPGSTATGYYASEQDSGYRDAERDAKQWLRARAKQTKEDR